MENYFRVGRPWTSKWRMCIVFCVPKTKNVYSDYVTINACTLQQWSFESDSILRNTYVAGLAILYRVQCWIQCRINFIVKSDC